jgi:polyisoprenoid-binding protein YceI
MKTASMVVAASVMGLGGVAMATLGFEDPTPAVSASAARAGAYDVDGLHSSVVFKVRYQNVANFYGRFNEVSGTYSIDPANPSASEIDIAVNAGSVDSNHEGRDDHLRGPDFFAAKEFPAIRFVANSFEAVDADTIRATGDLTLRGVTKRVSVDVDWMGEGPDFRGGTRSGFETTLTINRSEFGVNYGVENNVLGDSTEITIAITGMQK